LNRARSARIRKACEFELEGNVSKYCERAYRPGTSPNWVKVKNPKPTELTSRYQIKAQAFACDITDGAAVDRLVGEVTKAFSRLDVLVNDAAYNVAIPFDNLTQEVWVRIMAINLTGADAADQGRSPCHEGPGARAASSTSLR
jgi:NAD(P)-dependent dehydrogenase (short-subunit alcohol dehydrogenase family)